MGSQTNICAICGANYRADVLFCPQDGAPLGTAAPRAHDAFIGVELPGRIRIEKLIGVGAAGRVYRGFQGGVDRPVAIKVLHAELSKDATVVSRFHREARVTSMLAHPHVVEVFVTGEMPSGGPGAGALYIVMECVDGISLRSALAAAGGAIQLPRALRIVLQLCDAVGGAHERGIVHRDIKPENVMLEQRSERADFVKVLDFGMARLPAGDGAVLTQAGLIFGTARYISPEGAAGRPVGPPGDVYAIATVLYQALAGNTPFEGRTAVEVLARQINDPPAPLRTHALASYVPEPIAQVIATNLSKQPEARSPDARAFARTLIAAAREAGLSPEGLVERSAWHGERVHEAAFVSAEATRQLPYGGDLARPIMNDLPGTAAARVADHGAPRDTGRPGPIDGQGARRTGTRGTLVFLLGCVAGGAGLAALGAGLRAGERPDATRVTGGTIATADGGPPGADGGSRRAPP
jgi:eukaryotic-like serine/threonine-protein kinase